MPIQKTEAYLLLHVGYGEDMIAIPASLAGEFMQKVRRVKKVRPLKDNGEVDYHNPEIYKMYTDLRGKFSTELISADEADAAWVAGKLSDESD